MDPIDLLRLLLDPTRLAVVGAVSASSGTTSDLAIRADAQEDEVLRTLGVLVQAGLVRSKDGVFHLDVEAWRSVAQELPQATPASPRVGFGMTDDEAAVLGRFFRGDRLVEVPAQRSKRLVVLERLALELEPGVRYSEAEINELLRRFHDDHATLRRLLVDEGFVDRAAGEYWRSGGRIV